MDRTRTRIAVAVFCLVSVGLAVVPNVIPRLIDAPAPEASADGAAPAEAVAEEPEWPAGDPWTAWMAAGLMGLAISAAVFLGLKRARA